MPEYCDITIKNHKRYNRKILFVIFKDCYIDDADKLNEVVTEYHKLIEDNKGISSVVDTRNIRGCKKTLAFSQGRAMRKYETIVRANLLSLSIIMDNLLLENLLSAIVSIQPFVIPAKVVKENKSALTFIIENFNKHE